MVIKIGKLTLTPAKTIAVAVIQPATPAPQPDASRNNTRIVKFKFSNNCSLVFNSTNKANVETSVKNELGK